MENFIFYAVLGHCCLHESQAIKNKKAKCFKFDLRKNNPKIPKKFRSQTAKSIHAGYWSMISQYMHVIGQWLPSY